MQITVINLASQATRWNEALRKFAALGLQPVRREAVSGQALHRLQISGLYSEELNRRLYHRPLAAGEIGCYASHIDAWQALLDSGEKSMAIFEDDVEIDADLPDVLGAVGRLGGGWDVLKLIGRAHEKIASRQPLLAGRELIAYRRVPSLTGAYVITAAGAEKLLRSRRPFGRPVDVDMRHWWENGLQVRGVHPYPVRGAPSSEVSTIGERPMVRGLGPRVRKLLLQAHYTYTNWRELNSVPPERHRPRPAMATGARPPTASNHARRAVLADVPRRRNLIVLRAGDDSLHRTWLQNRTRDFDLYISYYGKTPGRHRADADYYEERPGPKWPGIAALLQANPQLLQQYETFWFPDDDLAADALSIGRMFAFFCAYELCLAQPALTRNSYYTWSTLLQDERCHIRYTGFVEVMAPIFSREALRLCAPTFTESRSGWGLDWIWPRLCRDAGIGRIAILDATPVRHTRPVGGELYRNHPTMDPRADAAHILRTYGIEEVRAIAKYSFEGRVRDAALPPGERLLLWLKRLNGRRKHRAHV